MKERKERRKEKGVLWNGAIVVALLGAVAVFVAMLQMEKNILTRYEKGEIYVAAREIPKGIPITSENMDNYFVLRELDKCVIPETALSTPEEVIGLIPRIAIEKSTLLTRGMFESVNEVTEDMKAPVIAGLKAEDMFQLVGGTLRAGDRIHIYKLDEDNNAEPVWRDVYVQQVFDNAGAVITGEDAKVSAQRINVYMDSEDVLRLYSELSAGTIRVVKVCE